MSKFTSIQVPTRLIGRPLMVSSNEVECVLGALNNSGPANLYPSTPRNGEPVAILNGVCVIPIIGGLAYRGYGWSWRTTYQDIRKAFRKALHAPEVKAIVFDVCSPGGEVGGVFDLVDEIYQARSKKRIVAVANEDAFSAAYAIASAAHKVYLPRTGRVGSVGVIAIHYEQSRAEDLAGVKYTSIFSGERKNDFTVHETLSGEAKNIAQKSVDKTYELFVGTVARNRSTGHESIRDQQAAIFEGQAAVSAGLADGLKTLEQVVKELGDVNGESFLDLSGKVFVDTESVTDSQTATAGNKPIEQVYAALSAMLANITKRDAAIQNLKNLGFVISGKESSLRAKSRAYNDETGRAARTTEKAILAQTPQLIPMLIGEGTPPETVGTRILEYKHANDPTAGISNHISGLASSGDNVLIADAQRRADAASPRTGEEEIQVEP